jgi:DNA-directed RNA polymerase specialized sigma24 family protein
MINGSTKDEGEQRLAGYRQFYERHYGTLLRVAYRYSGTFDEAREATDWGMLEVFRLITSAPVRGDEEDDLLGRMKEKVIGYCLEKPHFLPASGHPYSDESKITVHSGSNSSDDLTHARRLIELLRSLPKDERLAYNLGVIDRFPEERVAQLMGVDRSAVLLLVTAARQRCRRLFHLKIQ